MWWWWWWRWWRWITTCSNNKNPSNIALWHWQSEARISLERVARVSWQIHEPIKLAMDKQSTRLDTETCCVSNALCCGSGGGGRVLSMRKYATITAVITAECIRMCYGYDDVRCIWCDMVSCIAFHCRHCAEFRTNQQSMRRRKRDAIGTANTVNHISSSFNLRSTDWLACPCNIASTLGLMFVESHTTWNDRKRPTDPLE